jgi:hypothetical protein
MDITEQPLYQVGFFFFGTGQVGLHGKTMQTQGKRIYNNNL